MTAATTRSTTPEDPADPALSARLSGPRPRLDPRSHIARPDLVDIALAGDVAAGRYVHARPMRATRPRTALHATPDAAATAVSELLFGEIFDLYDVDEGWGFGRTASDRYTGWVPIAALADPFDTESTPITAANAPVFTRPDIKSAVEITLPFGGRVTGTPGDRFFALAQGGFVHNRHLAPPPGTPLEIARIFTGAPYLWGGRTPAGVDCSGLVQAALAACGIPAPRDSDQQAAATGQPVAHDQRQAGDIVFFPGHVGILATPDRLLHANAFWMAVVEEPLADVVARGAEITGIRRP